MGPAYPLPTLPGLDTCGKLWMTKDKEGHTMADLGTRLQEALTALRLDKEDLDHDQLSGLRNALDGAFEDGCAEGATTVCSHTGMYS